MKLQDLEIFIVGNPPPGWGGRYFIFVKLTTNTGITGYGEVYSASIGPHTMKSVIEDVFERHMMGENPENIEMMFRRAYSSGFTQRPDLTVIGAFSGLEIACWDILGKSHDRPIYALLGGKMNDRIRSYTYLYPMEHHDNSAFWTSPEMQAESAVEMVKIGFTAIKFDPAGPYTSRGGHMPAMTDIDLSVRMCAAIRDAVGTKADLLFGTHGQFTTAGAIRLGVALEPYNPLWYEEPVPPDNINSMAKVASAVRIPIATGERLTTKAEFSAVLRDGAATILQPALGRSGGILETKKIAAIAEVHNAQIAPHLYAGSVEWAANIQLAVNIPNILMAETILTGCGFAGDLINNSIVWEDGFILAPSEPGLGIEFNEELARSNPYKENRLHLEMQDESCDYKNGNSFIGGSSD
ncbi:MAG: mandelate racemase/muconate lactonizing enzyme family protein [Amylibacter sp.]|jgi:L-alanine-DL-glutamate epimerase-like enolase superfamily enzyme|tara:strand:+ start:43453 stop:44682 length:1230 start_codon:yes stop_codon:yes gene_type:complete